MSGRWAYVLIGGLCLGSPAALACTVFTASQDGLVLFGSNEDWKDPYARIWFFPPEEGKHGRIYFGCARYGAPEVAVNDQGLAFDVLAVPPLAIKDSLDKPVYPGNLVEKVMEECATVTEALEMFGRYNLRCYKKVQLIFADKTGDAAIIEGDVVHRKKGRYQLATNFYLSQTLPGVYPCRRYQIAMNMLDEMDRISVDGFRKILSAVHMEGKTPTLYSTIHDLSNGVIYLYHFHNFENVVKLDIQAELAKGWHAVDVADLFPPSYAAGVFTSPPKEPISRPLLKMVADQGIAAAIKKYRFLKEFEGMGYDFGEHVMDVMGYELMCQGKAHDALEWFKFMVDEHPDSSAAHCCLGEGYRVAGQNDLAAKCYQQAFQLDPDNLRARAMVQDTTWRN